MMVTQIPPPPACRDGTGQASSPPLQPVAPPHAVRALRAAFYGEFRPHLPLALALLAICGVLAALAGFNNYLAYHEFYGRNFYNILLDEGVRSLTVVGGPLIGLILGIAQARRVAAADMWGFMAHRPVSGALLFAGRALAGGALYAIAAGLPLAALLAFAASPHGGLPFHWRFMLPAIADGLSGLVYYFAGLLVVQREGYVVGSRSLPVVTAIGCSMIMALVPLFSEAVLVIAAATGLMAWAALGAVQTNGYRLAGSRGPKWATGAVLFAALGLLFLVGGVALQYGNLSLAGMVMRALPADRTPYSFKVSSVYVLLADGTLGLRIYEPPEGSLETQADTVKYTRYERVWPVKEKLDSAGTDAQSVLTVPLGFEFSSFLPAADTYRQLEWRSANVYQPANATGTAVKPKEQWYFMSPPGVLYGYDADTHAYLGSLGENGFAPPGEHAVAFGVPASGFTSMLTPRGQFVVDLDRRTVALKWALPTDEKVWFIHAMPANSDPGEPQFVALTRDRMLVYTDASAKPMAALPMAYGPDTHVIAAAWFVGPRRWAIWYEPKKDRYRKNVVEFFDQAGTRLGRVDLAERFHTEWRGNPPTTLNTGMEAIVHKTWARAGVIQAAGGLPGQLLMDHYGPLSMHPFYFDALVWFEITPEAKPFAWIYRGAVGLTLALAGLAMGLLARRYGVRHKWAWVAATVVLGPLMLVLLAALHTLPLRVRCPACQKRRFAFAPRCRHCGAAFPGPQCQGTEIFTPAPGGAA